MDYDGNFSKGKGGSLLGSFIINEEGGTFMDSGSVWVDGDWDSEKWLESSWLELAFLEVKEKSLSIKERSLSLLVAYVSSALRI